MSALKSMLTSFFIILSGAYICSTVFCTIFPPENNNLPLSFNWQVIAASICCTISTVVFYTKKEPSKTQTKRRFALHFLIVTFILFLFSYLGGWIDFTVPLKTAVFFVLICVIYLIIVLLLNHIDTKEAVEMNSKLKEIQSENSDE